MFIMTKTHQARIGSISHAIYADATDDVRDIVSDYAHEVLGAMGIGPDDMHAEEVQALLEVIYAINSDGYARMVELIAAGRAAKRA